MKAVVLMTFKSGFIDIIFETVMDFTVFTTGCKRGLMEHNVLAKWKEGANEV